jgi:1,4-dihydroxy-2-naphthoate polyprenyltransferase
MTTDIPKWRYWIAACRPKTLTVAFVAVLAGTALAFSVGEINWFIAFLTLICSLLMQAGANLINDAADFKTGADTEERLGFPRAAQMGWLSYEEVYYGGLAAFALAFVLAIPLVVHGGLFILFLLVVSIMAGYGYSAGPYPLAYHGLGEIFVLIFFGYVCTTIPYYLQTGVVDLKILLASTQIGVISTLLIAINNTRDIEGDKKAGKKTLAARYGIVFGKLEISLTLLLPFLLNLLWAKLGYPIAAFLPLSLLPLATIIIQGIWKHSPGRLYNGYFVLSALLHLVFGILLSLAFILQDL